VAHFFRSFFSGYYIYTYTHTHTHTCIYIHTFTYIICKQVEELQRELVAAKSMSKGGGMASFFSGVGVSLLVAGGDIHIYV
jgi:hypothetical protein